MKSSLYSEQEYLCPKCKYAQSTQGTCPKHGIKLLDYSAYVANKRTVKSHEYLMYWGIVILFLVGAVYSAYRGDFLSLVKMFSFP